MNTGPPGRRTLLRRRRQARQALRILVLELLACVTLSERGDVLASANGPGVGAIAVDRGRITLFDPAAPDILMPEERTRNEDVPLGFSHNVTEDAARIH